MGERVDLQAGHLEIEERTGYLVVAEHGTLGSKADVDAYVFAVEAIASRRKMRRVLIDSRALEGEAESRDVRDAMWKWLTGGRTFDQVAYVLPSEIQVARVNMLALSLKANLRAFPGVPEAHRWLTGRQRTASVIGMSPVTGTPPAGAPRSVTPTPEAPSSRPAPATTPVLGTSRVTGQFPAQPERPPSSPGFDPGRFKK